jgi:GTP-binding protein
MGSRKGAMLDMKKMGDSDTSGSGGGGLTRVSYKIPTRGLLGLRNAMLTATKGTAVLNTIFKGYEPWSGDITTRDLGSLVAHETGAVTGYALESTQARGRMFVAPGDEVYNGQVVGIHQRAGDLTVNVCKRKQATNIRSSGADAKVPLVPAMEMGLDDALEYIEEDELVEVTPESVRIRKGPLAKKNARGPKM